VQDATDAPQPYPQLKIYAGIVFLNARASQKVTGETVELRILRAVVRVHQWLWIFSKTVNLPLSLIDFPRRQT
jgi:hypothetical protein